ncbi:MAG TPA: hypothetical protein VEA99_17790 [Gemmatimonadaceae bacterium]|nr:hypothetical protein [Gemmatimonadaceae bacterium]
MQSATLLDPARASRPTGDYAVFGGVLRSELPFVELDVAPCETPDWRLRIGVQPPAREGLLPCGERALGPEHYRLSRFDGGFRLEYSHAGIFDLELDSATVTWYPRGEGDEHVELARSIVLGPMLALALEARGHLCLHGGAVQLGDGAVAFVAPKHHGKSTLVTALARSGARFISDDTLAVLPGAACVLRPGVNSARLWEDSARALRVDELCDRVVDGIKTVASGFGEAAPAGASLPLRAVYLLTPERDDADAPACRRTPLPPLAAAATLAQQAKLPDTLVGFAAAGARLALAARIASVVPVHRLHVARSFARLPEVVAQLRAWHGDATVPA